MVNTSQKDMGNIRSRFNSFWTQLESSARYLIIPVVEISLIISNLIFNLKMLRTIFNANFVDVKGISFIFIIPYVNAFTLSALAMMGLHTRFRFVFETSQQQYGQDSEQPRVSDNQQKHPSMIIEKWGCITLILINSVATAFAPIFFETALSSMEDLWTACELRAGNVGECSLLALKYNCCYRSYPESSYVPVLSYCCIGTGFLPECRPSGAGFFRLDCRNQLTGLIGLDYEKFTNLGMVNLLVLVYMISACQIFNM